MRFPHPLQRIIDHFRTLPGVGPKTAARFALHLLRASEDELRAFGHALIDLHASTTLCGLCQTIAIKNPCEICSDRQRDTGTLCIVAKPQDLFVIENTGEYHGLYHVLHGTLNPIEGVTPDQLKIRELLARISREPGKIREVLLALNSDMEGESTSIYLAKLLAKDVPKITRLARGLPMGGDVEYADDITLISAIKGRKEI